MVKKSFNQRLKAAAKARAEADAAAQVDCADAAATPKEIVIGPIVPPDGRRVKHGLFNLGNTCYMNSMLQCLNVSLPFGDSFLDLSRDGFEDLSSALCITLLGVRGLDVGKLTANNAYNPRRLHQLFINRFPWFQGGHQQDAHEFLRTLMGAVSDEKTSVERVDEEELSALPADIRPRPGPGKSDRCIQDSFGGHFCAVVMCWRCQKTSLRKEPFLDLSLEIPTPAQAPKGPLGLTAKMTASGSSAMPRDEDVVSDDGEDEDGNGRTRNGRRRYAPVPRASAASPALAGAWGKNAALEGAKLLVWDVVYRVLERAQLAQCVSCDLDSAEGDSGSKASTNREAFVDEVAAEQERRRKDFCEQATKCFSLLQCETLREMFGPEAQKSTPSSPSVNGAGSCVDLQQCLQAFSSVECIQEDLAPCRRCADCGDERTFASKRNLLTQGGLPPLISVQLKRFRRRMDGSTEKSKTSVRAPLELDLSDYCLSEASLQNLKPHLSAGSEPDLLASSLDGTVDESAGTSGLCNYELYAVCEHQGPELESGHYVAYVNNGPTLEKEHWLHISDAKVRGCGRAEVLESEAYVAFYRRRPPVTPGQTPSGADAAPDAAVSDPQT
eukprot:TRINITY_DN13690_c0_g1_i3.p1 TRINITY_DN13690_c0_g1~~TRINITY_DN13690_c0_g1_i3.p1  ORF type:complete len:625 (-),score=131.81 TRINITY_DN13690_c0_g1_i3:114-1949(-)